MNLDTTKALITLDEAKEYLKVSGTADDQIISTLINAVSGLVCGYLNRNLVRATYTEYYSGDGSQSLMLRNYPVVSITSIYEDDLREWASGALIDHAEDIIIQKDSGLLRNWNGRATWLTGHANIKVVYVAGYTTDFDGGTMPNAIRLATKRILDQQYRHGYSHRKLDVSSETTGDQSTSFREADIPRDAKAMLDPYRCLMSPPAFVYAD